MKNEEIAEEIEKEVCPTGRVGLLIGTLLARLIYADRIASNALRNLQSVYEKNGNDAMAEAVKNASASLDGVMGRITLSP